MSPQLYTRLVGITLEVASDTLTYRDDGGTLHSLEDLIREQFSSAPQIRLLTLEEAPWATSKNDKAA